VDFTNYKMTENTNSGIITNIPAQPKTPFKKIKSLINAKIQKFSELLTKSKLKQETIKQINISDLKEGMKGIKIRGTVDKIFPTRDFYNNGKIGKLQVVILKDSIEKIQVILLNEQVNQVALSIGQEVILTDASVTILNTKKNINLGFNGKVEVILPTTITTQK
jgi:hypothetical protein